MQLVSAWVYDLIVVVALAAVVQMLLPSGSFRRFAVLVMGLLVVLALVKPLLGYMQAAMPAGGGQLNVVPKDSSSGYAFSGQGGAAFPSADAALRDSLSLHMAKLVAATLALEARDVAVEVGLEGRAGWPGPIRYLRVRVLRAPEALIQSWLSSQAPGGQEPAGGPQSGVGGFTGPGGSTGGAGLPTREQAAAAIAGAVQSQLAAIYRLDPADIEVVVPR